MVGASGKTGETERFLLCRPRGGLNDLLVQVEAAWLYAERYGRTLLIDARRSGFLAPFDTCFALARPDPRVTLNPSEALLLRLDALECRPREAQGRLGAYVARYEPRIDHAGKEYSLNIDVETGAALTFDFGRDHPERLLLHEQCGGGRTSIYALARLRLAPAMAAAAEAMLARIPGPYLGVHVRHSDLKTDFEAFFAELAPQTVGRRLLICSDSAACVAFAKSYFTRAEVFTVTETPDLGGRPLHENAALPISQDDANRNLLMDFMALASADRVLITRAQGGVLSGFGRLARSVQRRPGLRDALLGRPTPAALAWGAWNRLPVPIAHWARTVARV